MSEEITRQGLLTKAIESLNTATETLTGSAPEKVDVANQHRLIAQGYAAAAGLVDP